MIQTFVLNYMTYLSHRKRRKSVYLQLVLNWDMEENAWLPRLQVAGHNTSTKHNSILDINWLFLTQCQQPLFLCIILLELADDFEKSYGDGHNTSTTARKLKVFIILCKSTYPIKTNNQSGPKLRIVPYGTSHCVAQSLYAVWHPTAPESVSSAMQKPQIS
jgi:hypothetical protein